LTQKPAPAPAATQEAKAAAEPPPSPAPPAEPEPPAESALQPASPPPKPEPPTTVETEPEPPPPPAKSLTEKPAAETQTAALPPAGALVERVRVLFQEGSAVLSEAAKGQLTGVATFLEANASVRVQLLAYAKATSESPSRARRLSLSRALAVRAFLIEQGVRSTRMDVRALGDKAPDGPVDRVDVLPQAVNQ
jgi:outer membrane protein OmpA-like peptidoglycan-associated protein